MSINISEVLVVLVVALLVIKPENLPDATYKLGKWMKWLRETMQSLRNEFEKPPVEIKQEKNDTL